MRADGDAIQLLSSHDAQETVVEELGSDVWQMVTGNSLYYETAVVWQQNLAQLAPLVAQAKAYRLTVGENLDALLKQEA